MTEVRQRPTPRVCFRCVPLTVYVKREFIVFLILRNDACSTAFHALGFSDLVHLDEKSLGSFAHVESREQSQNSQNNKILCLSNRLFDKFTKRGFLDCAFRVLIGC